MTEDYTNNALDKVTDYTYDKAGNRLSEAVTKAGVKTTTTYAYNEQNRLLTTTVQNGTTKETTRYTYDNNGNMTGRSLEKIKQIDVNNPPTPHFGMFIPGQSQGGATKYAEEIAQATAYYEYNVWNQLVKTTSGANTTLNKYNGDGLSVEKTVNGITTRYLYEYDKVVLETDDKGRQTARNVYGTNLISRKVGAEVLYYMYNGHADVTALIDNTGTVQASYYYDAFGTPIAEFTSENSKNNPIRYAGYQYDSESGLYYLNARYYDSKIARFLSEDTYAGDPSDPLSLNLYTYCHNEPVMYTDPSGHTESNDRYIYDDATLDLIDYYTQQWETYDKEAKAALKEGDYTAYNEAIKNRDLQHTLAEQTRQNYAASDVNYYSVKNDVSISEAIVEVNLHKATNTISKVEEVGKNLLYGVASSAISNAFASVDQQISMVNTILGGSLGIDVNKMMYNYLQLSSKCKISLQEYIELYVTNETAYYTGRLITDAYFISMGIGQVSAGAQAIDAGLGLIGASGIGEVLSGGALTFPAVVATAGGLVITAAGTAEIGIGISNIKSGIDNGIGDFKNLKRAISGGPGKGFKAGDTTPNGYKLTKHAAENANKRGFTGNKIDNTISNHSQKVYQPGGQTVYAKKNGNYYDVVIVNKDNEVITVVGGNTNSLKTWNDVTKMLKNNGGYSSLPVD